MEAVMTQMPIINQCSLVTKIHMLSKYNLTQNKKKQHF